jgi:hypothetical protein
MRRRSAGFMFASTMLLAAGCVGDGIGPGGPSWFRATLEGEVTGQYEGTGAFAALRDEAGGPRFFMISSEDPGPERRESFYIRWPSSARPGPGTYPLVPHETRYGSARGVVAHYAWSRGDNVSEPHWSELYVAAGGVVEITRSTAELVEGTIRLSGIQTERNGPMHTERMDPRNQPDPTAPRIEVSGSFRVAKWDENGILVRVE